MNYDMLSDQDKLNIAKDTLRGKESDHFRFSLLSPEEYGGQERYDKLGEQIASLQNDIEELTQAAEASAAAAMPIPAPSVQPPPAEPVPEPQQEEPKSK
jgi:hypothetical protein